MDKKQVKLYINQNLERGTSKEQIKDALVSSGVQEKSFYKILYRYPDKHLREKYNFLIYSIIGLLLILIPSKIYALFILLTSEAESTSILIAEIIVIVTILILLLNVYLIFKKDIRGFNLAILLSLLSITSTASNIFENLIPSIIDISISVILLILAVIAKKRLFPNIGLLAFKPSQ